MLKPRRLESGSQLSTRVPLLQGLEEERGFYVTQVHHSMLGESGQFLGPQALARIALPTMSEQQCAAT